MPVSEVEQQVFEYASIGRVVFGVNAVEQVGLEASSLVEGRRCLIITDPGVTKAGLTDRVEASLKRQGFVVDLCDRVEPEPTVAVYEAVLDAARSSRPDILVGVGGGSALDVAKVVAKALTSAAPLETYLGMAFETEGLPLITVPTTSGTGAEITPDAVVLLPEERVKGGFLNARATLAIVDPMLTLTVPSRLTAATGIDALSHAIESALSKMATPLTQALALESVRLIAANLRKATFDGGNLEARTSMAWATLIEGFSESNAGDVEAHAVGHLLGGYYRIHHGEACALALPYCMKYNLAVNEPILARIAKAMDETISGAGNDVAERGIFAVHKLIEDVGLPTSISEIQGALSDHLPELVKIYRTNPNIVQILELFAKRGVPSEEEATAFFKEMFDPAFSLR